MSAVYTPNYSGLYASLIVISSLSVWNLQWCSEMPSIAISVYMYMLTAHKEGCTQLPMP